MTENSRRYYSFFAVDIFFHCHMMFIFLDYALGVKNDTFCSGTKLSQVMLFVVQILIPTLIVNRTLPLLLYWGLGPTMLAMKNMAEFKKIIRLVDGRFKNIYYVKTT